MAIPVLAGVVMKVAAPLIVQKLAGKVSKKEADDIAAQTVQQIVTQVAADPVLKNEMNAEPLRQSRIMWGAVIAAFGVLLPPLLRLFGLDISAEEIVSYGGALVTIGGLVYVVYGRVKSGLRPLFSKG